MKPLVHAWPRRYPPGPEPRQPVTAPPTAFQKMRARRAKREDIERAHKAEVEHWRRRTIAMKMRANAHAFDGDGPIPYPDVFREHQPDLHEMNELAADFIAEVDAKRAESDRQAHMNVALKFDWTPAELEQHRQQRLNREGLGTITSAGIEPPPLTLGQKLRIWARRD